MYIDEIIYKAMPSIFTFFILYAIVLYTILIFSFRYRKDLKNKESLQKRRDSINFCMNDKMNYEQAFINQKEYSYTDYKVDNDRKFNELLVVLTQFDKISIAVNNCVYDENIIKSYYGKYFVQFYEYFNYFILTRRNDTKNPFLFIEYEKLAINWSKEYEYTRRAFNE